MSEHIDDYVVTAFHDAQKKFMKANNSERINTWHVSDFVSPCIRKSWYQRNFPDYAKADQKKTSVLFHGLILHEHTQLSHFHEVTMCYDIKQDQSLTPQEVRGIQAKGEPTKNIITGTLDDLLKIGDEFVIVDKKTWNARGKSSPYTNDSYKMQLNIYRVLLKHAYDIDAKFGCLLYLDKGTDFTESPLSFELDPIEKTKEYMRDVLHQIKNGLPKATVCWLCNGQNRNGEIYCSYKERCDNDGI